MRTLLAGWLGAGLGLGVVLMLAAVRGVDVLPVGVAGAVGRRVRSWWGSRRVRAAVVAGLAGWLVTGWLAAGAIGAGAVVGLPGLFVERDRKARIAKTEAIATWTEMLRDAMAAADGVEAAISATVPIAPAAIRREVASLSARAASMSLPAALVEFGRALDHPSGDLVVAALIRAAQGEGSDFVAVLSRLAAITRDEVRMRLRVETGRARIRTSSRLLLGLLGFAFGALAVFNRGFLEPYGTAVGQVVLVVVAAMVVAGALLMERMSRLASAERFTPRHRQVSP